MTDHRSFLATMVLVAACSGSSPPGAVDGPPGGEIDADPTIDAVPAIDAPPGPYLFTDSLENGTLGNAIGGSFGPDGWTVTAGTDRIWFALPRLSSGSIEFTVANMTNANLVRPDNEIFALYEAGYGITEPINYSPEFRNNHYKAMLRIYGSEEPDRHGLQKLMWGMCPSGAPGYDGCGCGSFFEEPFGGDGAWSGAPEQIKVEWGGGITRLRRNGNEVLAIDWAASGLEFGPSESHFSLGTARPSAVDTASMPIGAVFSNLVITGTEEAEVATCP